MFFNKLESQTDTPQQICILGHSATGLYLAYMLQTFGHNVSIICSPSETEELNATDIIIKNTHKRLNQRYNFNFFHELPFPPQILIISSDITSIRSDLLLINPQQLNQTLIINFTPTYPFNFISKALQHPIINGYVNNWIYYHKNNISLLSQNPNINISLQTNDEAAKKEVSSLFPQSMIDIKFNAENLENFWNWLAPNSLAYLLETAYDKPLSTQTKSTQIKQDIDKYLKELSELATQNSVTLNKNTILNSLFSLNEKIYTHINERRDRSRLYLERITSMIFSNLSPDYKRYPNIYSLIQQISKKL